MELLPPGRSGGVSLAKMRAGFDRESGASAPAGCYFRPFLMNFASASICSAVSLSL